MTFRSRPQRYRPRGLSYHLLGPLPACNRFRNADWVPVFAEPPSPRLRRARGYGVAGGAAAGEPAEIRSSKSETNSKRRMIRLRQGCGATGQSEQNGSAFRMFFLELRKRSRAEHLATPKVLACSRPFAGVVSSFALWNSDLEDQRIAPAITSVEFKAIAKGSSDIGSS
jgi:hypothetical protein